MTGLRILDAGRVDALRSQSLWHGIAQAMTPDSAPVLSLCQPGGPYLGLGYHRSLDEIDLPACERLRLSVIRRQIGGGPVYIDSDQLFFQITIPAARAPRRIDRLYGRFLEPAVEAFRRLGLDAGIRGLNDISVEDRRLSGTGAGRIGDGVTIVGNVIYRFPHERMAEVLAFPEAAMRQECLRLMRRHITSLEAEGLGRLTMKDARRALVDAYALGLELTPKASELTASELDGVAFWERRLRSRKWLEGPKSMPRPRPGRQVKISADVWCYAASRDELEIRATFSDGRLDRLHIASPRLNGTATEIAHRLMGCPIDDIARRLLPFGHQAHNLLELLEVGSVLR